MATSVERPWGKQEESYKKDNFALYDAYFFKFGNNFNQRTIKYLYCGLQNKIS